MEVARDLPAGHILRADYDAITAELTAQTGVACLGLWAIEGARLDGTPDPSFDATHVLFTAPVDEQIVEDVIDNWPPGP